MQQLISGLSLLTNLTGGHFSTSFHVQFATAKLFARRDLSHVGSERCSPVESFEQEKTAYILVQFGGERQA